MATLFALLSAATYGAGDFAAGLAGRRSPSGAVAGMVVAVEVFGAALAVGALPGHGPSAAALLWGALSGVGSAAGTLALYHGLSVGRMAVVATLSGVVAAVLPVLVGVALGDRLGAPAVIGICLAVPAIVLTSRPPATQEDSGGPGDGSPPPGAAARGAAGGGWGLIAGGGFALVYIALDRAGTRAGAWPLLPGQALALLIVLPFAVRAFRRTPRPDAVTVRLAVLAGLLSAAAVLLFLEATGHGELAIVAVLGSPYPAATVVLARFVLREHWSRPQMAGLVTATAAIVLVSAR